MSAPESTQQAWPDGQAADIEYATGSNREDAAVTRAVRRYDRWYDQRTGFEIPPSFVRSVSPLYLVSLDAAIEAAAKHLAEADLGLGSWLEADEEARAYWRGKLRSLITAAVMGGAQ